MKKINYTFGEKAMFALERLTNYIYIDFTKRPKKDALSKLNGYNFQIELHLLKYMIMNHGEWTKDWVDTIIKHAVLIRDLTRRTKCGVISRRELFRELYEYQVSDKESVTEVIKDLINDEDYKNISPDFNKIDVNKIMDKFVNFYEYFIDKFILNDIQDKNGLINVIKSINK